MERYKSITIKLLPPTVDSRPMAEVTVEFESSRVGVWLVAGDAKGSGADTLRRNSSLAAGIAVAALDDFAAYYGGAAPLRGGSAAPDDPGSRWG